MKNLGLKLIPHFNQIMLPRNGCLKLGINKREKLFREKNHDKPNQTKQYCFCTCLLLRLSSCGATHLISQFSITCQTINLCRQLCCIVSPRKKSGFAIFHQFRVVTDPAADHWFAHSHGLQHNHCTIIRNI